METGGTTPVAKDKESLNRTMQYGNCNPLQQQRTTPVV